MTDYERLRDKMVRRQLASRDISDGAVLGAMRRVPRHLFVEEAQRPDAYSDHPLPVGCGQTISQPYIVALMTQLLRLTGDDSVLEIGTGSGYQTAILAELAAEVHTVERLPKLADGARNILDELGYGNIHYKTGDGTLGWPEHGPYDGIIVTAAAPHLPRTLTEQLAPGGRLVVPVGARASQTLKVIENAGGRIRTTDNCRCVFVKLIGEEGWRA